MAGAGGYSTRKLRAGTARSVGSRARLGDSPGAWLSLVEHPVWGRKVAGSNPAAPMMI